MNAGQMKRRSSSVEGTAWAGSASRAARAGRAATRTAAYGNKIFVWLEFREDKQQRNPFPNEAKDERKKDRSAAFVQKTSFSDLVAQKIFDRLDLSLDKKLL